MTWAMIDQAETVTINMDANTTGGANTFTILKYLNNIWGPLLAIAIVVFMLISAQREDWRSAEQGQGYY